MPAQYSIKLDPKGSFIVGEERGLAIMVGILCTGLFLFGIGRMIWQPDSPVSERLLLIAIGPAFVFFRKARSKTVIIKIDASGLIYYGKRLFTWPDFISAQVKQEEGRLMSIQDNFKLHLKFRKEDGIYQRILPLTNTQNKSEEEILAAIRFYSGLGGAM